jgi:hypothetical protein
MERLEKTRSLLQVLRRSILYFDKDSQLHSDVTVLDVMDDDLKAVAKDVAFVRAKMVD